MAWFSQLTGIARNTWLEAIRQPMTFVLVLIGMAWIYLQLHLSSFTFENDDKLMINSGISVITLIGLILSAFVSSNVITREIENKTVLTVISKSIPRPVFLLGKALGVMMTLIMALVIWSCMLMLITRHEVMQTATAQADYPVRVFGASAVIISMILAGILNYVNGWSFGSSLMRLLTLLTPVAVVITYCFNKDWQFQSPMTDFNQPLYMSLLLASLAVLMLSCFAIAASTRLKHIPTIIFCILLYVLGFTSEYIFSQILNNPLPGYVTWIVEAVYRITPNLQYYWVGDAIADDSLELNFIEQQITLWKYTGMMTLYSIMYSTVALALGIALFQRRDIS